MVTGRVSGRLRRFACLALGMFAVFLMTAQLEHHDLACHLKTPQHCSACAASPLGADPNKPATFEGGGLTDVGRAVLEPIVLIGAILPARSSGRSPPSAS
jgi:hypothetical protein